MRLKCLFRNMEREKEYNENEEGRDDNNQSMVVVISMSMPC